MHSIECAWCCLHCLPSQGPYRCVVLAMEHKLGYLYVIKTFMMHVFAVYLLLNHMHAAQVSPFSNACMQSAETHTNRMHLIAAATVRATYNVDWFQGAAETRIRHAAA